MKMKRGSISLTFHVKRVVKAATKPNTMPNKTPPRPTTKKRPAAKNTSDAFTTGKIAT